MRWQFEAPIEGSSTGYALEIPRATLVVQVGAKERARLAIAAARRHVDAKRIRAT